MAASGELKAMKMIDKPISPHNVSFLPLFTDPLKGKQLVVKFDDDRGVVIVDGYLDPNEPPVPAYVVMTPSEETFRTQWLSVSAIYVFPLPSRVTSDGRFNSALVDDPSSPE